MLPPLSCGCITLSYNTPYWAALHPVDAACWGTLSHPTELCPFWITLHLLSNAAPYWAMGHSTELRCTLLSPLSCDAPYWATVRCTLLSYAAPPDEPAHPNLASLQSTEQHWTLLSNAEPYWARVNPNELRCSLTELHYSLTELPSVLLPLCSFVKCRTVRYRNKGTPVPYRNATVPDWDAGFRNTDAGGIGFDVDAQLWSIHIYLFMNFRLLYC